MGNAKREQGGKNIGELPDLLALVKVLRYRAQEGHLMFPEGISGRGATKIYQKMDTELQ